MNTERVNEERGERLLIPPPPPSRAELDFLRETFGAQVASLTVKNTDLERKVHTSDLQISGLERQVLKSDRKAREHDIRLAEFKRQMRELTRHLSASSSFAESPKTSAAEPRNRIDSIDGCVICFGPNNVVLLPCKHLCLCRECSANKVVDKGPICSAEVQSKMDIFPVS